MIITKPQINAFVQARHPDAIRQDNADGWLLSNGNFLSDEDAETAADSELWFYESGQAAMPSWAKTV